MWRKLFGLGGGQKQTDKERDGARLGIDVGMRYCPSCGDEYRSDIDSCANCRVPLISGADKLAQTREKHQAFNARSMEIAPGEPLVAIKAGKLLELKGSQLLLAQARIPSRIAGEGGDCRKG